MNTINVSLGFDLQPLQSSLSKIKKIIKKNHHLWDIRILYIRIQSIFNTLQNVNKGIYKLQTDKFCLISNVIKLLK